MILDVVLGCVLVAFVLLGTIRGALAAGTSVVSLLLGYGAGVYCAQRFAASLGARLDVSELIAGALAGSLGFMLALTVAGRLGSLLRGWDKDRLAGAGRGSADRLVGGLFGLVRGGLVVLLLAWLAIWLDAARDLGAIDRVDEIPQTEGSRVAAMTRTAVAEAVTRVLVENDKGSEPGALLMARLASNPGESLAGLREVLADDRVAQLQQDKLFWTLIENGASERALNRLSFYQVSHDDTMRQRLAQLGIVSAAAGKSVETFRDEARDVFDRVGPRLKGLREDPELQQLAANPEIVSLLESGDTLALLSRPEIQRLVDRLSKAP
ncbi:MAG: membrane protein required for colicin V production [Myxococcota bacterium]|jgi:membrane protein required for colicin V production